MILEVNTALLNAVENINSNQLIFLSLVLGKNQKHSQDVHRLTSLLSGDDISNLLSQGLVQSIERPGGVLYVPTSKLLELVKPKQEYFDRFYEEFPTYVQRKDGTKAYLRTNINKCRNMYNQIVGNSEAMAEHLIDCLKFEKNKKMTTGTMCYMKTMWRWLVEHIWEESEQEMNDNKTTEEKPAAYGNELI